MGLANGRIGAKWLMGLAVLLVALVALWRIGPALLPPEPMNVGIAIGDNAPVEMYVYDFRGQRMRIAEASGERGLVLMLQRSVDWCPFCKAELRERKAIADNLAGQGYGLASMTYDPPEVLAEFQEENLVSFDLLSDQSIQFVDAVGLRDPEYPEEHYAYGVPRASILVLSPEGRVRAKFVTSDYRQRLDNDELLALVDQAAQ